MWYFGDSFHAKLGVAVHELRGDMPTYGETMIGDQRATIAVNAGDRYGLVATFKAPEWMPSPSDPSVTQIWVSVEANGKQILFERALTRAHIIPGPDRRPLGPYAWTFDLEHYMVFPRLGNSANLQKIVATVSRRTPAHTELESVQFTWQYLCRELGGVQRKRGHDDSEDGNAGATSSKRVKENDGEDEGDEGSVTETDEETATETDEQEDDADDSSSDESDEDPSEDPSDEPNDGSDDSSSDSDSGKVRNPRKQNGGVLVLTKNGWMTY